MKGESVASKFQLAPIRIALDGPSALPWRMIREELLALAPAQSRMVDHLLTDLMERSTELSEREQVRELMIVILSGLTPRFPSSAGARPLDN